jgi:hypothetical protein
MSLTDVPRPPKFGGYYSKTGKMVNCRTGGTKSQEPEKRVKMVKLQMGELQYMLAPNLFSNELEVFNGRKIL